MKTYYPAQFEDCLGVECFTCSLVVTFRDVPEAITQGDNLLDAIYMAEDALKISMEFYLEAEQEYPVPSAPQIGDVMIGVEL